LRHYALACIYFANNGDGWVKNAGWLNNTIDPCGWNTVQIECTNSATDLQGPFSIDLNGNSLSGKFPCEVNILSTSFPPFAGIQNRRPGKIGALDISNNPGLTNSGDSELLFIAGLGSLRKAIQFPSLPLHKVEDALILFSLVIHFGG
jgi:hypothetical protein